MTSTFTYDIVAFYYPFFSFWSCVCIEGMPVYSICMWDRRQTDLTFIWVQGLSSLHCKHFSPAELSPWPSLAYNSLMLLIPISLCPVCT